jgi:hypothetical protein
MKLPLEEIWGRALASPVRLQVQDRTTATTLRHQLYRWRKRQQKLNGGATEFDQFVISTRQEPSGLWSLTISQSSVEILEISQEEPPHDPPA